MVDVEANLALMCAMVMGMGVGMALMSIIQPQPKWFGLVMLLLLAPMAYWMRWNLLP